MKLTEGRFSNGAYSNGEFRYTLTVTKEEKQQILENQEDAKKWRSSQELGKGSTPEQYLAIAQQIQERIDEKNITINQLKQQNQYLTKLLGTTKPPLDQTFSQMTPEQRRKIVRDES